MGDKASADSHYPMTQMSISNTHTFTIRSKTKGQKDSSEPVATPKSLESAEKAVHLVVK